jgi:hypothetical protein
MNSSEILKTQMATVIQTLKQAAQDPSSIELDTGQVQELQQTLSNLVTAKEQQQHGGKQAKAAGASAEDESGKSSSKKSSW